MIKATNQWFAAHLYFAFAKPKENTHMKTKPIESHIQDYLDYCSSQKRLSNKSIKAYRTDLSQFTSHIVETQLAEITAATIEQYISHLHQHYQPKTVKRKIACLKAMFRYFEYRELISQNPFSKMQVKFREPTILPKTIPLRTVERLLKAIYSQQRNAKTPFQRRNALRDAAVCELLFATGMRISELCSLGAGDVNLPDGTILIYGKGSKERRIQICNRDVIISLEKYQAEFTSEIHQCQHYFANQSGRPLSDQAVRRMINKYASIASIDLHITPHMFRHTFATSLLEADVDIRYIQEMLGHSSINITEIYTHVAVSKQRDILAAKHPRKDFTFH